MQWGLQWVVGIYSPGNSLSLISSEFSQRGFYLPLILPVLSGHNLFLTFTF